MRRTVAAGRAAGPVWSDGAVSDPSSPAPAALRAAEGDDPATLRRICEQLVLEAVEHLRGLPRPWEHRGNGVVPPGVRTKSSPTDVVTAADTALEALVRARLAQLRPGDAVVGEESGGDAAT